MSIKNDSLTENTGVKSTGEKKESHIGKKILCVILALLLCVGISFKGSTDKYRKRSVRL